MKRFRELIVHLAVVVVSVQFVVACSEPGGDEGETGHEDGSFDTVGTATSMGPRGPDDPPDGPPDDSVPSGTWTPAGEQVGDIFGFSHALALQDGVPYEVVPRDGGTAAVYAYTSANQWSDALSPLQLRAATLAFNEAALAFTTEGEAVVVTEENDGGPHADIFVGRYDGNDWVVVGGGPIKSNIFSQALDIELRQDEPLVLYTQNPQGKDTSYHVPVIRAWDGGGWTTWASPSIEGGNQRTRSADLAVADDGTVYLAWAEQRGEPAQPENIVVLSVLEGSSFVNVDLPLSGVFGGRLTARGNGPPVVAVVTSDDRISVYEHDEGWRELGAPLSGADTSVRDLQIARLSNGIPIVSWSERGQQSSSAHVIHVAAFDGENWIPVGQSIEGSDGNDAVRPRLAASQSDIWLTWVDTPEPTAAPGVLRAARLE